jgi:hypothetical protein
MASNLRLLWGRLATVASQPQQPVVKLLGISLPGPADVPEGTSGTYKVLGSYDNNTTAYITTNIEWGENSPGGVFSPAANTVVGDGYVAIIRATAGGKAVSRAVNVVDKSTVVTPPAPTITALPAPATSSGFASSSDSINGTALVCSMPAATYSK